jgi:hypothetical protein
MVISALSVASATESVSTKVIRNDPGGVIDDYYRDISEFKEQGGTHVRIDGMCASACILWIHSEFGLEYCATPRGKLAFHAPYAIMGDEILTDHVAQRDAIEITRYFIDGMPDLLQIHWNSVYIPSPTMGDPTDEAALVQGKDLQQMIGACND